MKRIIIFGAGNIGKMAYLYLSEKYEVVAFADNNTQIWGNSLFNKQIISPVDIASFFVDFIVIATVHYKAIGTQLNDMGYRNIYGFELNNDGKTENYKLFQLEYLKFEDFNLEALPFKTVSHEVQSQKEKKVLMIAYSFPPEGGSAVQRPLKFVKYLQDFGYMPVVLTSGSGNRITSISDDSLEKEIPASVRVVRIDNNFDRSYLRTKEKLEEVFSYLYRISGSVSDTRAIYEEKKNNMVRLLPDDRMFWEVECIRRIEEFIDMNDIDLIWSTVPSYSVHMLGYFLKKKYGIPWVADYRDLWTVSKTYSSLYTWYTPRDVEIQRPFEKKILEDADTIVVAGGSWIKLFADELQISLNKLTEITNGYDEADFDGLSVRTYANKKFTLCYNGLMQHEHRNPCFLLTILNEMIGEDSIDKEKICWVINGRIKDSFFNEMKELDKYGIVQANGEITHRDCLQSGCDSDLMVFMGETGENGWINYPGKFYEYLRIGRPILCLTGHNSFQEKVLKETGLGENFDLEDRNEIKEYVSRLYKGWENGIYETTLYHEGIRRFDRRYLTGKLAEIFDALIGKEL